MWQFTPMMMATISIMPASSSSFSEGFDAMNEDHTIAYNWNSENTYALHYTQQDDGRFRIEILHQPDYGSRDNSLRITGRREENGRFFIDAGKPSSFRSAELEAANWMFYIQ